MANSTADFLTIRKDDLVEILQQWPEVMAELTTDAERLFKDVKVGTPHRRTRARHPNTALNSDHLPYV